jgi:hypothetical protein
LGRWLVLGHSFSAQQLAREAIGMTRWLEILPFRYFSIKTLGAEDAPGRVRYERSTVKDL